MDKKYRYYDPEYAEALRLRPGPGLPDCEVKLNAMGFVSIVNRAGENRLVRCNPVEFQVLRYLLHHYHQLIDQHELIKQFDTLALNDPALYPSAKKKLFLAINQLRQKMEYTGLVIASVSGNGYILVVLADPKQGTLDAQ